MRTESRRGWCAVCVMTASLVLAADAPAHAQAAVARPATHHESSDATPRLFATLFVPAPIEPASRTPMLRLTDGRGDVHLRPVPPLPALRRPAPPAEAPARGPDRLLPVMYASFGVLQALDAHSTLRAVSDGHRERNPVVAPLADHAGAMLALKAATTAGTIYMAHRVARRNRVAAIVLMVAVNSAYGTIVAANYGKGGSSR